MIAAHLGEIDEDKINNMSIPFFNDVLSALGRRLNYESISNLYGNGFVRDAGKLIAEAHPLMKVAKSSSIAGFLKNTEVNVDDSMKNVIPSFLKNDASWAEGLFD